MSTIIHVNRQHIAMNAKDGGDQLSCGSRAWIETDAPIEIVDLMTFAEARAA